MTGKSQKEATLTAKDVRTTADLSYRQLNDWDAKGALPKGRTGQGWRKYGPREVFTIMVCAEIRKRFGVPVESLRSIRDFMSQEGADHFRAAVELMATLGVSVYLLTDLRRTFMLDSELEFEDLHSLRFFSGDEPAAYIFLKVNPLVNRLLGCLKEPINLPQHGRGHDIRAAWNQTVTVQNVEEREVLRLLRDHSFRRVHAVLHTGKIQRVVAEQELDINAVDDLVKLVQSRDYQTVHVVQQDGNVVRITRDIPIKFKDHKPAPRDSGKLSDRGGKQ